MREIEARIRALWERLARENRRLLALLRAGHTLAEAEKVLRAEEGAIEGTDERLERKGGSQGQSS